MKGILFWLLAVSLALGSVPAAAQQHGNFFDATIGGKLYDSTHVGGSTKSVVGPASSTDGNCVEFDGTSGALLKDAGAGCGAGGAAPNVEDNSTTVTAPPVIKFTSGCTVSNSSGDAHVDCTGTAGGTPLETHTASSSATVDFTTGFSGSCKTYFLDVEGLVPASQHDLQMLVKTTGSWDTGANYNWAIIDTPIVNGALTPTPTGTLADTKLVIAGGVGAQSAFHGYLTDTQSTTVQAAYDFTGNYVSSGSSITMLANGHYTAVGDAITGIRFQLATGANINSGVFSLYCAGGSGGGGGIEITDGSNDVTGTTKITVTGGTVGGTTPNATLTISAGGGQATPQPPGRLTLQTGVPVMTADQVNTVSVFYNTNTASLPMPIWNGSAFVMETIPNGGQALLTMDSNQAAGNIYDIFAIDDPGNPGTMQLCTDGSAWSNSTTRAHVIANSVGLWTDAVGMSHCWNKVLGSATDFGPIAADRATYLGTVVINGTNGHTDWKIRPSAASGGSANVLGLCNAYNTVPVTAIERDSTSSWVFNTSATWRRANAAVGSGLGNSVKYIDCLGAVSGVAHYDQTIKAAIGDQAWLGCAIDWSSGAPLYSGISGVGDSFVPTHAICPIFPNIGLHTIQAIEATSGANDANYNGNTTQMLTVTIDGM